MAEEITNTNEQIDTNTDQDYLAQIAKLKAETVSRAEYDRLRGEHKRLLEDYVAGNPQQQTTAPQTVDIDALRKELYGGKPLSNLDYWTKTLELRKALMDRGEMDPFLPQGQKIAPDAHDIERANAVATVVAECIEYAQGDTHIFTNELLRKTNDTAPMPNRRRK